MKKCKKIPPTGNEVVLNLVAKHARTFNKAHVFQDKTKYSRKAKYKNQEPLPIANNVIGKGFLHWVQS
ncbi:hypothetical protein GO003_004330 [Methylicorpusculum oleiharenae]|uniref:DUF7230 family protein n=1 Tax=Methylicorpusculum oleiharenae TaxID=1338687 RepID=UPI001357063D|nr:hypothetical protein [Methylicorpusculum oleiharenae]MCD2449613.1 hypothetical protein [Methylicorpusculum oleiharenae]